MTESTQTLPLEHPQDKPHSLADAIEEIRRRADGKPLTIQQMVDILSDRGIVMVLAVVTMPFLFPVPTMGLSIPAGTALAIYGFCVATGRQPWLPQFLLKRELSAKAIDKMVGFAAKWSKRIERFLKPRLAVMNWAGINVLTGICLILNAFLLSLPLPIPATNAIPAAAIILLLLGQLERDGVFIIVGLVASAIIFALAAGLTIYLSSLGYDGAKAWLGM